MKSDFVDPEKTIHEFFHATVFPVIVIESGVITAYTKDGTPFGIQEFLKGSKTRKLFENLQTVLTTAYDGDIPDQRIECKFDNQFSNIGTDEEGHLLGNCKICEAVGTIIATHRCRL